MNRPLVLSRGDVPQSGCEITGQSVNCTCVDGYAGDGSFCEVPCPSTYTDPTSSTTTFPCTAEPYHGGSCSLPDGRLLVCDEGAWHPVVDACASCDCRIDPVSDFPLSTSPTQVSDCPPTISSVPINLPPNTTVLDLSNRPITRLRREFGWNLARLDILDLENTQLTTIPPGAFRGLHNLRRLDLGHTLIRAFPRDAFRPIFSSLRLLQFDASLHLQDIAWDVIGSIPNLHTLSAVNNAQLGPGLSNCSSCLFPAMRSLDLGASGLTAIPPWISGLQELRWINLGFNPLLSITADDLRNLPNLEFLDFGILFQLQELAPDAFAELPRLQTLQLASDVAVCSGKDGNITCTCPSSSSFDGSICALECTPTVPAAFGQATASCTGARLGDECVMTCADAALARSAIFTCAINGEWKPAPSVARTAVLRNNRLDCLSTLTSAPTLEPTATPTSAPPPAEAPTQPPSPAPRSSSSSGGSSSGVTVIAGAVVGALVLAGAVLLAAVLRRRASGRRQRRAILGELTELMQVPNTRAAELFVARFAGTLGSLAESDAKVRQLQVSTNALAVASGHGGQSQTLMELPADAAVLGEGEHGRVVLGRLGGRPVAVKMLHEGRYSGQDCVNLLLEARVMAMLPAHEHVVGVVGLQLQQAPVMLAVELCEGGDLRRWLQGGGAGGMVERDKTGLCLQVARGLAFLHTQMIVHRDLAARNVLVAMTPCASVRSEVTLKLGDLGLSRGVSGELDYYRKRSDDSVPVKWMCPTAAALKRFSKKSDVWSFGVLMWEVWSDGAAPYANLLATEVLVRTGQGYRLAEPDGCPGRVYGLMRECWAKEETARPGMAGVEERLRRFVFGAGETLQAWGEGGDDIDAGDDGRGEAVPMRFRLGSTSASAAGAGGDEDDGEEWSRV